MKFGPRVWFLLREMFRAANNEQCFRVTVLWQFGMLSHVVQAEVKWLRVRSAVSTPDDGE